MTTFGTPFTPHPTSERVGERIDPAGRRRHPASSITRIDAAERPEPSTSSMNPVFTHLLGERIIMLGSEVRDDNANEICAALLLLAAQSATKDISLYINSPGGSVTAGMAIYDTLQFIECDVSTVAMGMAASMGQFLLSAGTPGKRFALPHARIMMHQPSGGMGGSASDIKIQAEQMLMVKRQLAELTAEHTGQTVDQIELDADRDRWFTAAQAQDYGLIDRVMTRTELRALAHH
jgi:ATP-dependent Clp protease protease subunit